MCAKAVSIVCRSAAAMRYTEVRLTKLAEEMIREDIDKETVEWVANYDGSETEPAVLPARDLMAIQM